MYTVIILDKNASEAIKNYKFLFKPFVDEGIIGFCNWNESGTDVKSAVPDLYSLIKGKKEWRAVVLDVNSLYGYKNDKAPLETNPFDYSSVDQDLTPHESEIPLIRLSHIIGGYDASPAREFQKGFEYYDSESGKNVRIVADSLSVEELQELSESHEDIKSIYIEKAVPKEIEESRNALANKYLFTDVRPIEIDLIALRQKKTDNEKQRIIESWKDHFENSSSSFWEKNKYPNMCRFMVYDITNPDNSLFAKQIIEFWLSVITFSINKISASSLQAYRIYKINVGIDSINLSNFLNEHLNKMSSAYTFVKEQMRLGPNYSFEEEESVLDKQFVPVVIEMNNGNELYVNLKTIGLCRDCPTEEMGYWQNEMRDKNKKLDVFFKKPRRSIDKSARLLKKRAQSFVGDTYCLDEFQLDDLKEEMTEIENNIVVSETTNLLNRQKINNEIKQIDKEVKKEISLRLKKKTVIISSLAALIVILLGYVSYVIDSYKISPAFTLPAVLLVISIFVASSIGGLIVLFIQRRTLKNIMKKFNILMRKVINNACSYADRFQSYFTDVLTYMKGQSIINGIENSTKEKYSTNKMLNAHKLAMSSAIARDKEWFFAYDLTRTDEIKTNVTSYFDVNVSSKENALYFYQRNLDEKDIQVNRVGDYITSPYKFVNHFYIEREDIFDEEEF